MAECAFQKAAGFWMIRGSQGMPSSVARFGGSWSARISTGLARRFLFEEKVIAAGCGDKQEGFPIGFCRK